MPAFHLEVPHNLGRDEAIKRMQGFTEKIQADFQDQVKDLQQSWDDNKLNFSFRTYGFNISGACAVEEDRAVMDGTLPFAAVAFRGKIEQAIRENLERVLK